MVSMNVIPADASVNAVLGRLSCADGDLIKGQSTFAQYYQTANVWYGSLSVIDHLHAYKVKLATPQALRVSGVAVPADTQLTLYAGWNHLPYLPSSASYDLNAGLPTHAYAEGDLIKSTVAFARYYASYGWYGSLSTLAPANGYMLKVATGGTARFP